MTVAAFIAKVRRTISDSVEEYRWGDPVLLGYINDGIALIYDKHPEAAYITAVTTAPPEAVVAGTVDLPITQRFTGALEHYVASRAMEEDEEDAANMAVANDHYQKFAAEIA